jgi:hypothetical protein
VLIRNCCLLRLSETKRRLVVVVQTYAAVDVCCRDKYTFGPWFRSDGGTSGVWLQCHLVREICCPGGCWWGWNAIPGAGATVHGAGAVQLSDERRHLAREFFAAPQKLGIVRCLAGIACSAAWSSV